jgi:hypothetical protein
MKGRNRECRMTCQGIGYLLYCVDASNNLAPCPLKGPLVQKEVKHNAQI